MIDPTRLSPSTMREAASAVELNGDPAIGVGNSTVRPNSNGVASVLVLLTRRLTGFGTHLPDCEQTGGSPGRNR